MFSCASCWGSCCWEGLARYYDAGAFRDCRDTAFRDCRDTVFRQPDGRRGKVSGCFFRAARAALTTWSALNMRPRSRRISRMPWPRLRRLASVECFLDGDTDGVPRAQLSVAGISLRLGLALGFGTGGL